MRFARLPVVLVAVSSLAAGPLQAVGGTLTNGAATFKRTSFGTAPAADLTGVSTNASTDHLFQIGFWYRVAGDIKETPMPNPDVEDYSFVTDSFSTWNDVDGRGLFSVDEHAWVYDGSADVGHPAGFVGFILEVRNLTAGNLNVDFFHYADVELEGDAGDSAYYAQKTPQEAINLVDGGGAYGQYLASEPLHATAPALRHFTMGAWSTLITALDDNAVTNWTNTPATFSPGDFTGGFQYSLALHAGASAPVTALVLIHMRFRCGNLTGIFCDGFETGDRSFWGP